ncbi:MAG: 3-dehydroquinate synthase [Bacteroidetes bacterium]|nr:3-dehydroquinate synthase [Bacteroidota bacterium]
MTDQLQYRHRAGHTRIVIGNGLNIPGWLRQHFSTRLVALVDFQLQSVLSRTHPGLLESFDLVIEFPDGEQSKSFQTYTDIITRLSEAGADRQTVLVAIGGGVTGDLTGFVAATYLRGIRYIQVPTTLLSQIDSSIGGKTGINLDTGKNLVGAFWQPDSILVDTRFLLSLPDAEVLSALGEMLKYNVLFDAEGFNDFGSWILNHPPMTLLSTDFDRLTNWISRCIGFKTSIVEEDEFESGRRALLNLGHTLGHALEKVYVYPALRHGDAVTIGTAFATLLSHRLGYANRETADRVLQIARRMIGSLPDDGNWDSTRLLDYISRDKKKKDQAIRWILPVRPGHCEIVPVTDPNLIGTTMKAFTDEWNRSE